MGDVNINIEARDRVSQTLDGITNSVQDLLNSMKKINNTPLTPGGDDPLGKLNKGLVTVGKGFQSVGGKMTKYITKPAVGAAGLIAGLTLKKGFTRMQEIDEARAKINAMGQDFGNIKEAALAATKGTAFALNEALTAGASAAAAGVSKSDMPKYMQAVADTAAAAGTSFDEMGMVFNKVMANGKIQAEEWNMLTDRGVDAFGIMRKATGKTNEELIEMRKNGELTSDMFLDAFANAYEKVDGKTLAQRIGESTITGAISNINASLARVGANFLGDTEDANSFAHRLLDLLHSVLAAMDPVEEKAKELGEAFGNFAGPHMDKLKSFFDGIADGSVKIDKAKAKMIGIGSAAAVVLGPALTIAGKAMVFLGSHGGQISKIASTFKTLGPKVLKVGGPIALIATGLIEAWKNSENFRSSVTNLFSSLMESAQSVATALGPVFKSLLEIIGPIAGALGDLLAPLVDLMAQYAEGVADKIKTVAEAVTPVAEDIADAVSTASDKIEEMGGAWEAIKSVPKKLSVKIDDKVKDVIETISEKWEGLKSAPKTLAVNIASGVQDRIDAIKEAWGGFKTKGKELSIKVAGGAQKVLEKIKDIWEGFKAAPKNLTLNIIGGAKELLDSIVDIWNNLDTKAKNLVIMLTGASIIVALRNIRSAWGGIKAKTKTLAVKVAGGAAKALKAIKSAWNSIKAKAKSLIVRVLGGAKGMLDAIKRAWDLIKTATKNLTVRVLGGAAGALNGIRGAWNAIKNGATKVLNVITRKKTTGGGSSGGKDGNATGTKSSPGGLKLVGERGPEIVDLPKGASVHTARETESILKNLAAMQMPAPIQMPTGGTVEAASLPVAQPQPQAQPGKFINLSVPIDINLSNTQSGNGLSIDEIISEVSIKLGEVLSSSAEGVAS